MSFRRLEAEPITDLAILQREINQLFEKLAEFDRASRPQAELWLPAVDVFECRGNLIVVMEVPGLRADSLKVVAREGALSVSGERRERRPNGAVAFHCLERAQGRFIRDVA